MYTNGGCGQSAPMLLSTERVCSAENGWVGVAMRGGGSKVGKGHSATFTDVTIKSALDGEWSRRCDGAQ